MDEIWAKDANFDFSNATLYVTVEPCIMCASALYMLGVKHVVFGCKNDKFGGCGSILHINEHKTGTNIGATYTCQSGLYEMEAIEVLRQFYLQENPLAPKPQRKKRRTTTTTTTTTANAD